MRISQVQRREATLLTPYPNLTRFSDVILDLTQSCAHLEEAITDLANAQNKLTQNGPLQTHIGLLEVDLVVSQDNASCLIDQIRHVIDETIKQYQAAEPAEEQAQ
jgi:hypothetical protein